MKKIVLSLCLFITACATVPNYEYKINSLIQNGKGKTIKIVAAEKSVLATQMKDFYRERLKNEGFKVVDGNANYTFTYGNDSQTWQTMQTVPTYGRTGVRSVNNYGTASTFGNTTYGSSTSYVNYDYGINGYQNVVVDHHFKSFMAIITDNKSKDVVYEATFVTTEYITDEEFMTYLKQVQNQYPMMLNTNVGLICYDYHCEVPHSPTLWGI
ncbi:MAG: hypothetical protein J6Y91_04625 [Alphaproteobacteria bacterium]|nr:hypothetical protein [Alphaproteobacteria bacterium]